MTSVAVMQPYFFPYIGYYQLLNYADYFVVLDDVSFRQRSWITRNQIRLHKNPFTFSIPIQNSSQNSLIKDLKLYHLDEWKKKFLKTIYHAYSKYPNFKDVNCLIQAILNFENNKLSEFLFNSILTTSNYLSIQTPILSSSDIGYDRNVGASDRMINICKSLNCDIYINLPGGKSIYNKQYFAENNIDLRFLEGKPKGSKISIIHDLMENSETDFKKNMLNIEIL